MPIFELSESDVARLGDAAVRDLVARLAGSEIRERDGLTRAVRWGGAQSAPDGGLDVEVLQDDRSMRGNFVPRWWTGFQVKKSKMPASKIAEEMSPPPDRRLRPIIAQLAEGSGSYIIVSSTDGAAGTRLTERTDAMRAQLVGLPSADQLYVDFYDARRLADWLREHPSVREAPRRLAAP